MIRWSCALSLVAVGLVMAMVARPNMWTTLLCIFVAQPALLAAVALFVLNPVHAQPVQNHRKEPPS